jgi:hypothetical protein
MWEILARAWHCLTPACNGPNAGRKLYKNARTWYDFYSVGQFGQINRERSHSPVECARLENA